MTCLALSADDARAYCRTRTCEFDGRFGCELDPETACAISGLPTYWPDECLSLSVQRGGSTTQGIAAEAVASLSQEGLEAWTRTECEAGQSPRVAAVPGRESSCTSVGFDPNADNENLIVFRDRGWRGTLSTLALTTVTANLQTGEVVDADVELNSEYYDFHLDAADARPGSHDLRVVLNHELGHFLGLAHSFDASALMHFAYDGPSPLPGADDAEGICSIYASSESDPECDAGPASDVCEGEPAPPADDLAQSPARAGCSVSTPGSVAPPSARRPGPGWPGALGLLLGLWSLRGARRRAELSSA